MGGVFTVLPQESNDVLYYIIMRCGYCVYSVATVE